MSDTVFTYSFDRLTSQQWRDDAERNRVFLQAQQNYMNHRLRVRGVVFLNEVFDALGFKRTSIGQTVGWSRDGRLEYIHFGWDWDDTLTEDGGITLRFEVDGPVVDKLDEIGS